MRVDKDGEERNDLSEDENSDINIEDEWIIWAEPFS